MNPNLQIYYEASNKYMDYMNFHTAESNQFTSMSTGPLAEEFRKFKEAHTNGERLTSSLFSDPDFIRMQVNPSDLIWGLYWVASDAQCTENKISFYDIFQPQELFDIWQCSNYQFYVNDANHTAGNEVVISNAKPLLKNIVESADEAINHPENVATLRFGHDGNVIPLIALMQIENFNVSVSDPAELYKYWCNFKTAPMAGNVQIVFFKKEKGDGDILVKILLHEKEVHIPVPTNMFPYYKWEDVRNYFMNRIEK